MLGTAQDGGFPHAGCRCDRCSAARDDPTRSRRVACLGLVDGAGRSFLVDATPDLPSQVEDLPKSITIHVRATSPETCSSTVDVARLLLLGRLRWSYELYIVPGPNVIQ